MIFKSFNYLYFSRNYVLINSSMESWRNAWKCVKFWKHQWVKFNRGKIKENRNKREKTDDEGRRCHPTIVSVSVPLPSSSLIAMTIDSAHCLESTIRFIELKLRRNKLLLFIKNYKIFDKNRNKIIPKNLPLFFARSLLESNRLTGNCAQWLRM